MEFIILSYTALRNEHYSFCSTDIIVTILLRLFFSIYTIIINHFNSLIAIYSYYYKSNH